MAFIHIASVDSRYTEQTELLAEMSTHSQKHTIVNDPQDADIVLIGDVVFDNFCEGIRKNTLLKQHADKCFLISCKDKPRVLFRGMYTSGEQSSLNFKRVRTCAYTNYSKSLINKAVDNYDENEIEKKFLFSFTGANSHKVRSKLFDLNFDRNDILIVNTSKTFNLWLGGATDTVGQYKFAQTLAASKFSLCPRGHGASSIRLFESMKMGIAPIIISDEWILPHGPAWNKFSIIVKSKELDRLEEIASSYEHKHHEMGKLAKEAYYKYFDEQVYFDYLVENCLEIKSNQIIPELFYYKTIGLISLLRFKAQSTMDSISLNIRNKIKRLISYQGAFSK